MCTFIEGWPPLVPTELYHRDYYLHDCEGWREFRHGLGRKLSRRLRKCFSLAAIEPRENVIDVGSGRGELSLHAAALGATVLAVDPSGAAQAILRDAAAAWRDAGHLDAAARLYPLRGSGALLPVADAWADVVILSDVVEHLRAGDLRRLGQECCRVLRPGGRLVLHTQPNRILVDYTVPVLARFAWLWGVKVPVNLRDEMTPGAQTSRYHPSEQSLGDIRRWLRAAGLNICDAWLEGSYPLHRIFGEGRLKTWLLPRFRSSPVLKSLFAGQVFAIARRGSHAVSR